MRCSEPLFRAVVAIHASLACRSVARAQADGPGRCAWVVRPQEHGTEIPDEIESPDTDAAGQKHASQCRVLSEHAGIQG